ncbi:Uncharacterised protein [Vibrio cholerae]|uniref:Uncharacterized protein n=1 Tax=Vibrio cholerae TaxID=666 RepID=A0A656AJ50_VIBCL|nr:Uncharacterised protein [Vibrio cholerae]CSA98934.1 Uncharacterised protein [Vibrio cholerae]CSB95060.1 Uncharacterised protein [Vibrio cholerae]CSC00015.1 Uncharacterised protein [Vibrio cholerae]CSD13863.1 Uncharacterised protein [Vibrio cholerae]
MRFQHFGFINQSTHPIRLLAFVEAGVANALDNLIAFGIRNRYGLNRSTPGG